MTPHVLSCWVARWFYPARHMPEAVAAVVFTAAVASMAAVVASMAVAVACMAAVVASKAAVDSHRRQAAWVRASPAKAADPGVPIGGTWAKVGTAATTLVGGFITISG